MPDSLNHTCGGPPAGRSLLDLDRSADDHERVVFCEYHAMGAPSAANLVRKGRSRFRAYVDPQPESFDREAGPEEKVDLPMDPDPRTPLEDLTVELPRIVDGDDVDNTPAPNGTTGEVTV